MQPHSEEVTKEDSENRQDDGFPVDVHGDFLVEKAEHLDRRQFPDPFGNVDVGQVIQDYDRQQGGNPDQNGDHGVKAVNDVAD